VTLFGTGCPSLPPFEKEWTYNHAGWKELVSDIEGGHAPACFTNRAVPAKKPDKRELVF
jgi:hypothetical protein